MQTFVLEMEKKNILNYPDLMIDCTEKLLVNVDWLNVFVYTVFQKTK